MMAVSYTHLDVYKRQDQGQELVPGSVFGVVYNHQLGLALDRWVIDHALEMLRQRQLPTTLFIKVLPVTLQDKTLAACCLLYTSRCV